jgi:hypothetical protein
VNRVAGDRPHLAFKRNPVPGALAPWLAAPDVRAEQGLIQRPFFPSPLDGRG